MCLVHVKWVTALCFEGGGGAGKGVREGHTQGAASEMVSGKVLAVSVWRGYSTRDPCVVWPMRCGRGPLVGPQWHADGPLPFLGAGVAVCVCVCVMSVCGTAAVEALPSFFRRRPAPFPRAVFEQCESFSMGGATSCSRCGSFLNPRGVRWDAYVCEHPKCHGQRSEAWPQGLWTSVGLTSGGVSQAKVQGPKCSTPNVRQNIPPQLQIGSRTPTPVDMCTMWLCVNPCSTTKGWETRRA